MNNSIYKEKFKSLLIVVLFLSTVLLSYFFWQDSSFMGLKKSVNDKLSSSSFLREKAPELSSFIAPRNVQVNFGDGACNLYNQKAELLWQDFLAVYINFSQSENLLVEEISKKQWQETMDMKSIQYVFDYGISSSVFENMGAANFGQSNAFSSISVFAWSAASDSSLFLQDASSGKCYRIVSDTTISALDTAIDNLKTGTASQYYPISMLLGTDNKILVPFSTKIVLPTISAVRETLDAPENYAKNLAETFFGESLDFIRRINDDNGTTVYMYGYGQKILTVNTDGSFEYHEIPSSESSALTYNQALSLAINFISVHGGWKSSDGKDLNASLEYASNRNNENGSTFYFRFTANYNNYSVYSSSPFNISLEITGNQVTQYSRNMAVYAASSDPEMETRSNSLVIDILSNNYQEMARVLLQKNIIAPGNEELDLFDLVVENITMIDSGYFDLSTEDESRFVPSWVISFSGGEFFFDLYSGDYLGFINGKGR